MKHEVLALLAVAACGSEKKPPPPPPPAPVSIDAIAVDAAPPQLAPDREAFWAPYLGSEPGKMGPEALAFCRAPYLDDVEKNSKEITPEMFIARNAPGSCIIRTYGKLDDELAVFLARWGDAREFVDERERLNVHVTKLDNDGIDVYWTAHLPLEEIIGEAGSGVLVRGFTPTKKLFEKPSALRGAVDKRWKVVDKIFCDDKGCSADGPHAPGGHATTINTLDARGKKGTTVTFHVPSAAFPRVKQLVEAALGAAEGGVHRRDGIRYTVEIEPVAQRSVVVSLAPDN